MPAHNCIDMIGFKSHKLTVIGPAKSKRIARKSKASGQGRIAMWRCRCECGNEVDIRGVALRTGKTKSCGCLKSLAYYWKGHGDLCGNYWRIVHRHAKIKGREVTVSIQQAWDKFVEQDRKCALTGLELYMNRSYGSGNERGKGVHTASLDRIDSTKGYSVGNIQWVHKTINMLKSNLAQDDFVRWCELVASHATPMLNTDEHIKI